MSIDRLPGEEQGRVVPYPRERIVAIRPHRCSVVVVSYHTGPVLHDCLRSVLKQAVVTQLIVVDNGNSEDLLDELHALAATDDRVEVVTGHGNVGFSKGCNIGAARARGEYLLLLNPDSYMDEGVLDEALSVFDDHPDASALTVRLQNPDGSEQRGGRRNLLTPWTSLVEQFRLYRLMPNHPHFQRFNLNETEGAGTVSEVECISGAFMLMPRQVFADLGGMDEDYFLHVEDVDFCMRLNKAGGHILYVPDLSVTHVQGTSDVFPIFVEWHKARSAVRYFFKHFQPQYPRFLLRMIAAAIFTRFVLRLFPQAIGWLFGRMRAAKPTLNR